MKIEPKEITVEGEDYQAFDVNTSDLSLTISLIKELYEL